MPVAALYDIHGNLPALEAVLEEIRQAKVDLIVVGGDVVAGPMPGQTLECLLTLDTPVQCIQGNADREVLAQMRGDKNEALTEQVREIVRWVARQLDPTYEQVLASWPKTFEVEVDELGQVLFCHATPRNDSEVFTRLTPEGRLLGVFADVSASLVVCGHTHMQFDRRVGGTRILNAGSVGMPYGNPGAYWLLLEADIKLRHTVYDLHKAAERIQTTSYPQAQEFAIHNIVQPPTELEALEVFGRAELK